VPNSKNDNIHSFVASTDHICNLSFCSCWRERCTPGAVGSFLRWFWWRGEVDAVCPTVAAGARGRSVCRRELPWPPDLTSRTCFFPVIELMDVSCSRDVVFCFLEDRG
jgi:hypothetical protein